MGYSAPSRLVNKDKVGPTHQIATFDSTAAIVRIFSRNAAEEQAY